MYSFSNEGDKLKTGGPEDNLLKCTEQMLVNSFRHLPVLADDLAVGVISIRDIARTILQCTGQVIMKILS